MQTNWRTTKNILCLSGMVLSLQGCHNDDRTSSGIGPKTAAIQAFVSAQPGLKLLPKVVSSKEAADPSWHMHLEKISTPTDGGKRKVLVGDSEIILPAKTWNKDVKVWLANSTPDGLAFFSESMSAIKLDPSSHLADGRLSVKALEELMKALEVKGALLGVFCREVYASEDGKNAVILIRYANGEIAGYLKASEQLYSFSAAVPDYTHPEAIRGLVVRLSMYSPNADSSTGPASSTGKDNR